MTLNTHKGLYKCTRLLFGIAFTPAIFQHTMDTILQGIPNTACYLDDILVTGKSEADHLQHLEEVLCRLQEKGVRLHCDKYCFFQSSVEFLGHCVEAKGVHTSAQKVKDIDLAHAPHNINEL